MLNYGASFLGKMTNKNNCTLLTRINNWSFYLLILSIVLLRIPDLYFISSNPLFTTQVFGRTLLFIAFFFKSIYQTNIDRKNNVLGTLKTLLPALILILFVVQSLSILAAVNYQAFFIRYFKDILPGIIIFFTFALYREKYKTIVAAIVLPTFFNIFYQFFMAFMRNEFLEAGKYFVYSRHWNFTVFNLDRNRLYIDTYDEAVVPLLLLLNPIKSKASNYILFICISFLSFLSNWRIRLTMLLFGCISSVTFLKNNKRFWFLLLALTLITLGYIINSAFRLQGETFVDRFTFQDEKADIDTLSFRIDQISNALSMSLFSPLGVGLGNYYDNLNKKTQLFQTNPDVQEGTEGNIHNIIAATAAETGIISLTILIVILCLFVRQDLKTLRMDNNYPKALVLTFWTIFIFSCLNPSVGGSFLIFFWGIRGLLM